MVPQPRRPRKNHQIPSISVSDSDQDPSQFTGSPAHNKTGWAPFDGPRGPHRLGELDLSFLLAYAIGMYVSGHIGDTVDLRIFLTIGMVGSGIFVILFGLGYFLDLHSLGVFLVIQVCCGLFQSIGWPSVVAVVGNWFGKAKRGLIMGVWNSHTSIGNIIGSLVASSVLGYGWGWSFVLPGILIMLAAAFIYLFLVVHPENIGLELSGKDVEMSVEGVALVDSEKIETLDGGMRESEDEEGSVAIGFLDAWRLPHVASYAFCLFFSKLVAYTFLYWLPFYISHTAVAGANVSHTTAGILSTIFDIGGVIGGILAVAADLGTDSMVGGNARALATVTAIIDGTGSVGAALGPLLAGYISTRGWNSVFLMLIVSTSIAGCLLIRVVKNEIRGKLNEGKWLWFSIISR
ncbi:UNVERIFIED_CONTAM: putative glycerol-3-phosphate transporter 5 [Sesamum latifolium]|uniref:Glycerol-3-phosphate transporter 5 n=1 Tax=Sesamum latifolium TaxID=2727402 RepID=A0AAW2XD87_9LAMI